MGKGFHDNSVIKTSQFAKQQTARLWACPSLIHSDSAGSGLGLGLGKGEMSHPLKSWTVVLRMISDCFLRGQKGGKWKGLGKHTPGREGRLGKKYGSMTPPRGPLLFELVQVLLHGALMTCGPSRSTAGKDSSRCLPQHPCLPGTNSTHRTPWPASASIP